MPSEQSNLHQLFTRPNEPFAPVEEPTTEEIPEDLKNRHIRRLEAKVQSERESNIAMAARIEALSEARKLQEGSSSASWEEKARRIYGNQNPENAAASDLLVEAIKESNEQTYARALSEARRELQSAREEESRESKAVSSYIEQVEDTFGVDFTSTPAAREKQQEFRDLWYRLSPKDANGEVKDYADPFEVFEIYNSRQSNPAKELASRGMVRSRPVETASQDDATTKYLRENGIIDPF